MQTTKLSRLFQATLLATASAACMAQTNGTMLQYFDWDSNGDGQHWNRVKAASPAWAARGITAFWLPPGLQGRRRRLGRRLRRV